MRLPIKLGWSALVIVSFQLAMPILARGNEPCIDEELSRYLEELQDPDVPFSRPIRSNPAWVVIDAAEANQYSTFAAISDIHGDFARTLKLLRSNGLINKDAHWTGGRALLVVAGDLINKGPQSLEVVRLFKSLEHQAQASGGRVIVLMGNHEARLLGGQSRITPELVQNARNIGEDPRSVFRRDSDFMRYLSSRPVGIFLGGTLIAHTGFVTPKSFRAGTIAAIQRQHSSSALLGKDSIFERSKWERDKKETKKVRKMMDRLGIHTVIFGHQPNALGHTGVVQNTLGDFIKIDSTASARGWMLISPSVSAVAASGSQACARANDRGIQKALIGAPR